MNKHAWSGIIIWGISVTCFGVGAPNPTRIAANFFTFAAPDQEGIFLLAGGIVTILIGIVGLFIVHRQTPVLGTQSGAARHCIQA